SQPKAHPAVFEIPTVVINVDRRKRAPAHLVRYAYRRYYHGCGLWTKTTGPGGCEMKILIAVTCLSALLRAQNPAQDPYGIGAALAGEANCPVFISAVPPGSPAERA